MFEPKFLKRWTHPENYFGAVWPNYYSAGVGQSRDSDALERSNFICMLKALGGEREDDIVVVRERHWAVGWVEWIAIQQDCEKELQIADEIIEKLEDYPVINEEHWSELEFEETCEAWTNSTLQERIDICKQCGISIFAARHDYLPNDDRGCLSEYLLGH